MIKHIGIDARRDLERIFGTQVFLELDVKVKAGWRDDEAQIRRFGYTPRTKDARRAWQAPGHIATKALVLDKTKLKRDGPDPDDA